ncbi:PREDICTED: protein SGT1 homolog A isoform X1 [Camelina sativa]|uniref:Protein SGT1 homolog A isoform X1 n=1 Tax=Camelina sativa TaxID=90675 RepID=A0ABM0UZS8_CAMSA|nr:PREDICTED: protein SGT1 homolog A isoform X1 [Camelina sativa]XP_010448682.1 PREDICTED: protein SGT1 homolog A isoform X2 [Camelina sativa]XP_019088886.1 PREDICTED: protein SGT1 homolog A isoform X1 [Camelina sativa]
MAKELADKAKEAFIDDEFDVAVDLYSKAIDLDPNCADFFADRAQSYIKLLSFTEAVADANKAIELDPSLTKAYLRKGTACMKLEEYRTAKTALEKGASIAPSDSKFKKLIDECDLRITEEEKDLVQPVPSTLPLSSTAPSVSELDLTPAPAAPAKPKYMHEYYQKPEEVVVTVFAKGIPKQNVNIDFGEQILSVVIDVPGEEAYYLQPRLFGKIIPDKCKYEVLSTKIEIRLAKADIITWPSLEHGKGPVVLPKPNVSSEVSQRLAYPSSKKVKDWDKLEAEVKKQEKDEKLEGDAALNKFFRDIYSNADEDMRRAMSKSFVESNGTVLSTNWQEVGTKKIESTPPDGMELKKWEI